MEKLAWQAPEYAEQVRTRDWFWALGVIVATVSIAAIIFQNYFFAGLIILGGGMLGFLAIKKPDMISYELGDRGLQIRSRLYPFKNMRAFWIISVPETVLLIKTERIFMPIVSIPIHPDSAEKIGAMMLSKNIPAEEMQEHAPERILEVLGF